jgi:hypothetical protein
MSISNFAIFKNTKKEKETQPDYTMSVNTGTKEQPQYTDVAGIWLKEGKNGKFMSGMMKTPFQEKSGWTIEEIKPDLKDVPTFKRDSKGNELKGYDKSATVEDDATTEDIIGF